MTEELSRRLERTLSEDGIVALDGFHALKHALRFGAAVLEVVVRDLDRFESLRLSLAPDLELGTIPISRLADDAFRRLAPGAFSTGVLGLARRPRLDARAILDTATEAPVLLLENTRRLENLGACVRVAAAAGAAGVVALGNSDPWHRAAIRGAAGLQFALPVARTDTLPDSTRPIVAFDPDGEAPDRGMFPDRAIFAFGTEREGLTPALLAAAAQRVRIPMREGVSSLNIAAAVAAAFYGWRGLGG
ncbi:MAG: TrmH family RNA methyltransferase [Gemmatimonadota bacterium]|jgi:TrmH family RNA methyltransferase